MQKTEPLVCFLVLHRKSWMFEMLFQLWNSLQFQDNIEWKHFSLFLSILYFLGLCFAYIYTSSTKMAYFCFLFPHSGNPDSSFIPLHHFLHAGNIICPLVNYSDELIWVEHYPCFLCRVGRYEICSWKSWQNSQSLGHFGKVLFSKRLIFMCILSISTLPLLTWHQNEIRDVPSNRRKKKKMFILKTQVHLVFMLT